MHKRAAIEMILAAMLFASSALAREDASRDRGRRPEFGWALVSNGSTIATSLDEWDRLDERIAGNERVLFARLGGDEYLIRDRSTLDRVDQLVEPIRRLGEKARAITATRSTNDKAGRREWKERLRPLKEERGERLRAVSGEIEGLARDAVRQGRAQRLN
jgi:hypothetical protein